MMLDETAADEVSALQLEFDWLLNVEVNDILIQLQNIILECSRRFPVTLPGVESLVKNEKFHLSYSSATGQHQDQIKIAAFISGDNIAHADISLKLHKHPTPNQRFVVSNEEQWKLNQIQDASNHLMAALNILMSPPLRLNVKEGKEQQQQRFDFANSNEIVKIIDDIMSCLQKGRNSLIIPKKRTIEELQASRNMRSIQPQLPNDLAISFYVQSHKLICAVYYMSKDHRGQTKFDIYQAETSIPFLSELIVLFTVALQFCQNIKDKLSVFTQYRDMQKSTNAAGTAAAI